MKRLAFILFLLTSVVCVMAQNTDAMLFGDVKNKATGEHIPYARIQVKGTKLSTYCDKTGHFKLVNLPVGKQTVTASRVGYKPQSMVVTMSANKTTEAYFSLQEDAQDLDQVVVTGTRTEHFVKDVPIRTEVITSQAIRNKNACNIYEALQGVPGVRVEQQCQFCNFSMVRMQGLGAEHTQVLIDGEPIYSGLASVYGLQQTGTNDVDRLEVVKGAGSALYGSSAVAGAINIITKEPTFEPQFDADLQFGSYNFRNYGATASTRKNNVGISLFAQRTEGDPIDQTQDGLTHQEVKHKDGVSDRVASHLTNLGFNLYFFSPFAKNDKLIIRGKAIDEHRAGGVIDNDTYLNPFTQTTENIETNRVLGDLSYRLPIGEKSEANFSLAYVFHRRNATNDTFLSDYIDSHDGQKPDPEYLRPYLAREHTWTPSLTFTSHLGHHALLAGMQGYMTRLRETGLYVVSDDKDRYYGTAYSSTGKKHATEFGFFLQDEWTISRQVVVVPGLRFDTHSSGEEYSSSEKVFDGAFPKTSFNQSKFNPRLAIKYQPFSSLVLRANFGTGFRAPYGFSEDLHLCSGSPRVWKSSSLKGESAISFNLSADYYGRNYQLSANVFLTRLNNKIEFQPADDEVKRFGYTYEWKNVDDANVRGIELSAKWNPWRVLKTGVNWTFNYGKYDHERAEWKDTPYARASRYVSRFPNMTGDMNIEYTPGTWTFTLIGTYQGKLYIDYIKDDDVPTKIKETTPFFLFNIRAAKRIGAFTIYAGGSNIFGYTQDERHTDNAAFMYAPVYGATWYAGVRMKL